MTTYIYTIRPTRSGFLEAMTEHEEGVMGEHFAYLKVMLKNGTLIMAGPCEDRVFGIVVFRAESAEAARAVMEGDPSVEKGVMSAELHPFRVSLIAGNLPS